MRIFIIIYAFLIVATVSFFGFRGMKSDRGPLRLFPDMEFQDYFGPQDANPYFDDGMADRRPPAGVVLRGHGDELDQVFAAEFSTDRFENPELYHGRTADGEWARGFPIEISHATMERGKQRYEIFCTVCHGAAADGEGVTQHYGIASTNLQLAMFREMAEGEIFNTIMEGKGTMYGYGDRISPEDAWAIILYLRALQRSQHATEADVPASQRAELGL